MNLALSLANLVHYLAIALYILILARVLLSWFPISPWHPLVRILRAIVDPILRPFRRLLPTLGGIDLSPLVAILIIFFLAGVIEQVLLDVAGVGGPINLGVAIVNLIAQLLENIIIVLGVLVLIRLLVSVFSADPFHPLVMGIRTMTNPLVRPFAGFGRRGQHTGLDIPALITLIAYVILYVIVAVLVGNLLVRAF